MLLKEYKDCFEGSAIESSATHDSLMRRCQANTRKTICYESEIWDYNQRGDWQPSWCEIHIWNWAHGMDTHSDSDEENW